MSWGIEYRGYLSRVSLSQIDDLIEMEQDQINSQRTRLVALVANTSPEITMDGEMVSTIEYACNELTEILDALAESEIRIAQLHQVENDKHAKEV